MKNFLTKTNSKIFAKQLDIFHRNHIFDSIHEHVNVSKVNIFIEMINCFIDNNALVFVI